MSQDETSRRIHVLRDADARKIAAGEVIDRPLSVVRELIDNSIDARADEIEVRIAGGGIENIRVVDNGTGMSAADLETCILPHATSKIRKTEDIYSTRSLGFRGEALSSIAACSKLEITSTSRETSETSNRITVHAGRIVNISAAAAPVGTTVDVGDLFYALPGRRKFLKRVSSESLACKQAFIEKALPFPGITFRFFSDGDLKLFLPSQNMTERISAVYPDLLSFQNLDTGSTSGEGFEIDMVLTKPGFSRRDRRLMQTYVNGRRIQEYSLLQAIIYGYSEHLPGGSFPGVFLFVEVDPKLVDFNIHPAKREVRFRNLQLIHRATVDLVRSKLPPINTYTPSEIGRKQQAFYFDGPSGPGPGFEIREVAERLESTESTETDTPPLPGFTYHGQIFGLFLLVEYNEKLYVIDQHAAHERILFEKLAEDDLEVQTLLVPIHIELNEDEEAVLRRDLDEYGVLGFDLEQQGEGSWLIKACPSVCLDMKGDLADFIKGRRGDTTNLRQTLFATVACRAAVMDGEILDFLTGGELAAQALGLDNARCPHGRPIWFEISRDRLFELVERT
jgi:DNA mismatch repair protein MutL